MAIATLISLLITIIILGLVAWLVFWALAEFGLPEPFAKIARVLVVIIIVLYLLQKFMPLLQFKKLNNS